MVSLMINQQESNLFIYFRTIQLCHSIDHLKKDKSKLNLINSNELLNNLLNDQLAELEKDEILLEILKQDNNNILNYLKDHDYSTITYYSSFANRMISNGGLD